MFRYLKVENSFLDKDIEIEFSSGMNILVGPNGSGKTSVLNFLMYSLYGSQALTGTLTSYPKDFKVECIVTINGNTYKILRTIRTSKLYDIDDKNKIIATGTTAVNNELKILLSYDYRIFTLTNYIKQMDVLSLTSCTPNSLADLIETINGVSSSNKLNEYYKSLQTSLKAELKSLVATRDNTTPEEFNFKYNEEYDELLKNKDAFTLIRNKLESYNKRILFLKDSSRKLQALQKDFIEVQMDLSSLSFTDEVDLSSLMNSYEIVSENLNELSKLNRDIESIEKLGIGYRDEYTKEFLENQLALIQANRDYSTYLSIQKKLNDNLITCPNCSHEFHNIDITVPKEFEKAPEKPMLDPKEVDRYLSYIEAKSSLESLREQSKDLQEAINSLPSKNDLKSLIDSYQTYIQKNKELSNLKKTLTEISDSLSDMYKNLVKVDSDDISGFIDEVQKNIEATISTLEDKKITLGETEQNLIRYESDKRAFLVLKEILNKMEEDIVSTNSRLDLVTTLRNILLDTKRIIQSQTLPNLNSVASKILTEVTAGERSSIEITEDFNILVDSQPVPLLEGSAQAITNLSLRIALLNTFYKDSFLVFLGDEVDSSLHQDRADFLQDCLQTLSSSGYQIIIISHKEYFNGNIIDLGAI